MMFTGTTPAEPPLDPVLARMGNRYAGTVQGTHAAFRQARTITTRACARGNIPVRGPNRVLDHDAQRPDEEEPQGTGFSGLHAYNKDNKHAQVSLKTSSPSLTKLEHILRETILRRRQ